MITIFMVVNSVLVCFCFIFPSSFGCKSESVRAEFTGTTFSPLLGCIAVCNMPDCRSLSDCRSRGWEYDPSPVPYFCVD